MRDVLFAEEAYDDETLSRAGSRRLPLTFGFEIEQPDYYIKEPLLRRYEWYRDPSGPLETALPPSKHPSTEVRKFVNFVRDNNIGWPWVNEYRSDTRVVSCGSHVHLRPRDDVFAHDRSIWIRVWRISYNTVLTLTFFTAPLLSWWTPLGNIHMYRFRVGHWASYDECHYVTGRNIQHYLSEDYVAHPYDAVVFNRSSTDKPLTLEVRLAESHVAVSRYFAVVVARVVKECIERDTELKLHKGSRKQRLSGV